MLLRLNANATDLTGYHEELGADNVPYLTFRYAVVRIWEESIEHLLSAGAGLAPLALLTNEAAADLPCAFDRVRKRLHAGDVLDTVEHKLLGAAYVLCGLRYETERIEELFQELNMILEESTTYQAILKKGLTQGALKEAQSVILRQGTTKFGEASTSATMAIQSITVID
jgi:hypothetical protein